MRKAELDALVQAHRGRARTVAFLHVLRQAVLEPDDHAFLAAHIDELGATDLLRWRARCEKGFSGPVLRRLGAVAINRSRSTNVVDQMVEQFRTRDRFVLGIPPEGTRSRAEHWRSGFYHIALGAQVPVVPGYLDFGRKRAGLGAPIHLTGDVHADMDRVRAFYAEKKPVAFDPSSFGPIRLREEVAAGSGDALRHSSG